MKNKFFSLLLCFAFLITLMSPAYAQDQNEYPVYVVQSGDTLTAIADKFDVSLDALVTINNIGDSDIVSVGMLLYIPGVKGLQGVITTSPVQLGENLKGLTLRYRIDPALLLKLNHISCPGEIYVGSN
jgi:LysM repeat protein